MFSRRHLQPNLERMTVTDFGEQTGTKESGGSTLNVGSGSRTSGTWNIELLLDVELPISVSFGNSEMQLKDVLKLGVGSVIELDKSVNDPVSIIVNRKPIAKGEVVMVEGNYGVRVLEVESTADRILSLG
jgi:flagellar motor switch protein FliN